MQNSADLTFKVDKITFDEMKWSGRNLTELRGNCISNILIVSVDAEFCRPNCQSRSNNFRWNEMEREELDRITRKLHFKSQNKKFFFLNEDETHLKKTRLFCWCKIFIFLKHENEMGDTQMPGFRGEQIHKYC